MLPNVSELHWLSLGLGITAPGFLELRLFVNDFTPGKDTVLADFVEPIGGGYSRKPLDNFILSLKPIPPTTKKKAEAFHSPHVLINFTGPPDNGDTVFGSYIVEVGVAEKLFSARRWVSPRIIVGPGSDAVLPTIEVLIGV